MTEIQIAWLELMTVGGLGVILVLLGVTFNIIVKRQNQLCTKQTDGIVKQYGFPGNGRVYPIVEYFVNGTCYKTKKIFCGIKTTQISGVPVPVKSEVYEDEKGWLHVKTGSIANLRQLAEQLWPINSKMTVYYNPNNPKKCYVDRPISKSFTCNGVQREHNKKLNNGLPILHKVPPKRDYGRYFCIMAEKGGTSHGGLTEKLSPFFHAKKQEVNAYGR